MEKPIITLDFTINDIDKVREQNYEWTKDMTAEKAAYKGGTVPLIYSDSGGTVTQQKPACPYRLNPKYFTAL